MTTCTVSTGELNCGCCESIALRCDLQAGHPGDHQVTIWHETYEIPRRGSKVGIRWNFTESEKR